MTKKLFGVWAVAGLIVSLAGSTLAHDEKKTTHQPGGKIERSLPVDPQATVTLCVESGTLSVHGWDKNEIRVRSTDAAQIEFRRIDKVKDMSKPAARVDVMVMDKTTAVRTRLDCQAVASVEMEVPVGATVQVQTRDGDIMIAGIAAAYAGSQNGDINIERVTKLVEAGSVGGSIALRDSSGRVNLSSAGGGIEAVNVHSAEDEDTFEVGTVSGDIQLEDVAIPKLIAKTVNGTVTMTGPLVKKGDYGFNTVTGDIVLEMPHDASFQLNAKVSEKHNIVSDFPLKYINEPPPPPKVKPKKLPEAAPPQPPAGKAQPQPKSGAVVAPIVVEKPSVSVYILRRITAICGTGDAQISVNSFGGTVRLKKI
ncbi:MAG TPA: DUF4097 family beta strand repeat-containing protein [Pyrinomonadaceae bacterium]|nr:DUF4097 family beta strand repeat-containing protein [Pyrinomonadaceae bacterium]